MRLTLIGSDRAHDVQNVCLLFFPLSDFSSDDGRQLQVELTAQQATATFVWNGNVYTSSAPYTSTRFDAQRLAVKRAAYDVLSAATGKTSPWGLLTGIKSALYLEKLRGVYGSDAERIMREDYLVAPEKIALCDSVLQQRQPVVEMCSEKTVSLYISIPFCPTRCRYCSFVSSATSSEGELIDLYLTHMIEELRQKAQLIHQGGYKVLSIYIGGGTPTVLSPAQLTRLLDAVRGCAFYDVKEYTVEAGRPDTITSEKLDILSSYGVGRISVNPQTLNDHVLEVIGRKHTSLDFFRAYELARQKHFDINVDVIAGLPDDTFESFSDSFARILALRPENVTLHTLYVKRGADFGISRFVPQSAQAQLTGQMVHYAETACADAYFPYYLYRQKNTVGNHENVGYALPGKQCLYNIFMMDDIQTVVGVGANAATKIVPADGKIQRYTNTKYSYNYIKEPPRAHDNIL